MLPLRTCVSCRAKAPQPTLLRVALHTEGQLAVNARHRTGRSAYLCAAELCVQRALAKGLLPRALRRTLEPEAIRSLKNDLECQLQRKTP